MRSSLAAAVGYPTIQPVSVSMKIMAGAKGRVNVEEVASDLMPGLAFISYVYVAARVVVNGEISSIDRFAGIKSQARDNGN